MISAHIRSAALVAAKTLGAGISVRCGKAGFFGELFTALNALRAAERNGIEAAIEWDATSQYFEQERGPNVWDYYFERSQFDFSDRTGAPSFRIPFKPGADAFDRYDGLDTRNSVARALRRWCEPRPEIIAQVDDLVARHFTGDKTLGVHVRLTDAAAGFEGRKVVGIEDVFNAVDSWLQSNPGGGVFLATDDERAIAAFEARYPGRIGFQDCLRSSDGTSIHGHYDGGVAGSPYAKGREVIIDALALARCDHLVRTHSRVTCFTLCWNPQLTYNDLELELLGVDLTPWLRPD